MAKSVDSALGNPCDACRAREWCADFGTPRYECLEFWPLSQPAQRSLRVTQPQDEESLRIALGDPYVCAVVRRWEAGAQVTDDEYLDLRRLYLKAPEGPVEEAHLFVIRKMLMPKMTRYISDARRYYGLSGTREDLVATAEACQASVLFADDAVVSAYPCPPVPSRFERVVLSVLKALLWGYTIHKFIDMPRDETEFKQAVEEEWRRVLFYEDGFHGFTVVPMIHMDDLVRYQQLGGGDPLVSHSISDWVIWSMTAFPLPVQIFSTDFCDKAYGERLRKMYEPLVSSYAFKARARAKKVAYQSGADASDVPAPDDLLGEFRALLRRAIDEYDFMYGKAGEVASSVGSVGFASSREWREKLQRRLDQADVSLEAHDLVHVGFSGYVVGKFREHLRRSYPSYNYATEELDDVPGALVDGEGDVFEVFREETERTHLKSDAGTALPLAFERNGVDYLYVRQMAFVAGVTVDQLRNWDRRGHLETMRVREIDPDASEDIADRRVYPYTSEMIGRIQELAERKGMLQSDPKQGVLSRAEAARRLGITPRTLDNWRKQGKVKAAEMDHRVFVAEAEVERLLAERDGDDTGPPQ